MIIWKQMIGWKNLFNNGNLTAQKCSRYFYAQKSKVKTKFKNERMVVDYV